MRTASFIARRGADEVTTRELFGRAERRRERRPRWGVSNRGLAFPRRRHQQVSRRSAQTNPAPLGRRGGVSETLQVLRLARRDIRGFPPADEGELTPHRQPPPPFTNTVSAVMNGQASEHMNSTSSPISSGSPKRPIGTSSRNFLLSSALVAAAS